MLYLILPLSDKERTLVRLLNTSSKRKKKSVTLEIGQPSSINIDYGIYSTFSAVLRHVRKKKQNFPQIKPIWEHSTGRNVL